MAAGRVATGFSKPYVAIYNASAGVVSYTSGRRLARGVNVNLSPESSEDNNFYADNVVAESASGIFTGGTVEYEVDGLLPATAKMIYGLPEADADGWTHHGDSTNQPYVATGYIVRWMQDGVTTYQPTILTKGKFAIPEEERATQEDEIDWQTTTLTSSLMRDDSSNHDWKLEGKEYATEDEAELALIDKLNATITYVVQFESNGGTAVVAQAVERGGLITKPDDPTKPNATLAGWFKDEALTDAWDFDTDQVASDMILYAKWTED